MSTKRLVFDIETIGADFDSFDETTQENLTRWIKKESDGKEEYEEALKELKEGLGFSPLTGEIVAIGTLDLDEMKGGVYFQAPGENIEIAEENGIKYRQMTEKGMLEQFWQIAQLYDEFISFNGRQFDGPFLMVRSAYHGLRPTKNLSESRYVYQQKTCTHIDLLDQLSFQGNLRRKGSLHMWANLFGIKSPKEDGVTGDDVARLFKEKKYLDIAKYNGRDLFATKELYDKWARYLSF